MKKVLLVLIPIILLAAIFAIAVASGSFYNKATIASNPATASEIQTDMPISSTVSGPIADFSCQPNECGQIISDGINGIAYPSCNPLVQINNTGSAVKGACDYWRTQQKYFGTEDYVKLSQLSKERKRENHETIVDGFLGLNDADIEVHVRAAPVFLHAEEAFNEKYGANRVGSTYFLSSYPNGYTFSFGGSLNKRARSGSGENLEDGLLYNGEYITPSQHFWGAAIDLNTSTNWGNRLQSKQCMIDIPPELVSTFEANGLRWGGRFFTDDYKFFDPMHFEVVPDCIKPEILKQSGFN